MRVVVPLEERLGSGQTDDGTLNLLASEQACQSPSLAWTAGSEESAGVPFVVIIQVVEGYLVGGAASSSDRSSQQRGTVPHRFEIPHVSTSSVGVLAETLAHASTCAPLAQPDPAT